MATEFEAAGQVPDEGRAPSPSFPQTLLEKRLGDEADERIGNAEFIDFHSRGSDRLRGNLVSVGERFVGFDKALEEDALKRRLIDEKRFEDVMANISRLQRALSSEVKRRVDASKTLQQMTEQLANDMFDRLQKKIRRRIEKITSNVEVIQSRCRLLEQEMQQLKGEVPSKLFDDSANLMTQLSDLKAVLQSESSLRRERDDRFNDALSELEKKISVKVESEFSTMEDSFSQLLQEVANMSKVDTSAEEQFRSFIIEELSSLKGALMMCTSAREQSDDEILVAMNQYSNALQKGMRAANLR